MFSNVFVVFILILGAAVLGFIVAWLFRQSRIDKLTKLNKKLEGDVVEKDELLLQYSTDRDLLKEDVEKFKQSYNMQLTKTQRLSENIRRNQSEIEESVEKVKNLTEISVQSQEEVSLLDAKLNEAQLIINKLSTKAEESKLIIDELNAKVLQSQTTIENQKQIQAISEKIQPIPEKAKSAPIVEPTRRVISETRRIIRVNRGQLSDIRKGGLSLLDKQKR